MKKYSKWIVFHTSMPFYATRSNKTLCLLQIQIEIKEKKCQFNSKSTYHEIFILTLNISPCCFVGTQIKAPLPYVFVVTVGTLK